MRTEGVMRGYEFPSRVTAEGTLEVPDEVSKLLSVDAAVRVIVLIGEESTPDEDASWDRLTAEEFLAGYAPADSIYDRM